MKKILFAVFSFFVFTVLAGCKKSNIQFYSSKKAAPQTAGAPGKIVCLSPAGAEILYALDAQMFLTARTDFCDFPEQIKKLPTVGGFDGRTISLESIVSYTPDFVYAVSGMHDMLLPMLNQLKIPYYVSNANSIQSVYDEIIEAGKIVDRSENADKLVFQLKKDFAALKKAGEGIEPVSVYWEIWNAPYMSIGKASFINELIEAAGGRNIFADQSRDYPIVSEEAIISRNPQVIIIPDTQTGGVNAVLARPAWQNIDAIRNKKVYALNSDTISRPGPRIFQAAKLISETIHE